MAIHAFKKQPTEPQLPGDDQYITIKEFCKKYSIGRTRVYEFTHIPDFPVIKIGRSVRIPERAAHKWLLEWAERSAL